MFVETQPRTLALLGVVLGLFSARPAEADEARVHLAWVRGDEAGGCVDQRGIEAGVAARLGRNPFVDGGGLNVEGSVERAGNVWRADIRVRDEHGALVGRRALDTEAGDCGPIAEAVILAIALVIDPNAAGRTSGSAATAAQPPPMTAAAVLPQAPPSTAMAASTPCPVAPSCPPAAPCPACANSEREHVHADVFARVLGSTGLLPRTAPGAGLFGAYIAPSFELTASLSWFPDVATADERFAFGLVSGGSGACYRVPVGESAAIHVCVEVEVGSHHAVVRDLNLLTPLDAGDHLWVAAAAGPRVTVDAGHVRFEAGAVAVVPMSRKEFQIQGTGTPIFQASAVAGLGFLGIGFGAP